MTNFSVTESTFCCSEHDSEFLMGSKTRGEENGVGELGEIVCPQSMWRDRIQEPKGVQLGNASQIGVVVATKEKFSGLLCS